eukprot:gene12968-13097_t
MSLLMSPYAHQTLAEEREEEDEEEDDRQLQHQQRGDMQLQQGGDGLVHSSDEPSSEEDASDLHQHSHRAVGRTPLPSPAGKPSTLAAGKPGAGHKLAADDQRQRPTSGGSSVKSTGNSLHLEAQSPLSSRVAMLQQTQTKCIFEELNANVIVVGDYNAANKDNPSLPIYVDVKVSDPHGAAVHENRAQTKGQFAFTSKVAGEYQACFTTHDLETAHHTKLSLDWRTGVAATDWDTIAKKEHLDQLSVEMRKVEGQIREIYAEMLQLQQREQEMRDLNEETNTRVAWFSIVSLAVCVASAGFQLIYLKKFFQRKKLL